MRRWLTCVALLMVWVAGSAGAEVTTYNASAFAPGDPTDSAAAETVFLSDVAAAGFTTFFEGFTGEVWSSARSPQTASSITTQE